MPDKQAIRNLLSSSAGAVCWQQLEQCWSRLLAAGGALLEPFVGSSWSSAGAVCWAAAGAVVELLLAAAGAVVELLLAATGAVVELLLAAARAVLVYWSCFWQQLEQNQPAIRHLVQDQTAGKNNTSHKFIITPLSIKVEIIVNVCVCMQGVAIEGE